MVSFTDTLDVVSKPVPVVIFRMWVFSTSLCFNRHKSTPSPVYERLWHTERKTTGNLHNNSHVNL
jgi:hypothetical protein